MSARKKTPTANPVLDGLVDVPPAAEAVRVRVRVKSGGPERRYRAGLGPIGLQPVEVEASPEQVEALKADPWIEVCP